MRTKFPLFLFICAFVSMLLAGCKVEPKDEAEMEIVKVEAPAVEDAPVSAEPVAGAEVPSVPVADAAPVIVDPSMEEKPTP